MKKLKLKEQIGFVNSTIEVIVKRKIHVHLSTLKQNAQLKIAKTNNVKIDT